MPDQGAVGTLGPELFDSVDSALRLTADIAAAALAPDGCERMLTLLARRFGTTKGALVNVDSMQPKASQSYIVGVEPALATAFHNRDLNTDHLYRALRRVPQGSVVIASEVLSDELTQSAPLWGPDRENPSSNAFA